MTIKVLKPFKAKCNGRVVQHNPGERLQVKIKVVSSLVSGGFIRLLEPMDKAMEPIAAKIYSKILDDTVWVVTHQDAICFIPDGEIYYLPEEIQCLKGASLEDIQTIHRIKRALGGKLISVNEREEKAVV